MPVLGKQQEALRLEETVSVATLLEFCLSTSLCCLSVRCYLILLACVAPARSLWTKVLLVLFSRGRITGDFSLFAYLKFLPSTPTFFME